MTLFHVLAPWMVIVILLRILLVHIISKNNKETLVMPYTLSTFAKILMMKENLFLSLLGNSIVYLHVVQIFKSMNLTLSLSEETIDKYIDQVHVYENLLDVVELSRVRLDESYPTSFLKSLINDVNAQRNSNTLMDEVSLGLKFLIQAFNEYTMNEIEPTTSLLLIYPKLID